MSWIYTYVWMDADIKVFPDPLLRMVSCMVHKFGGVICLPSCFSMYCIKAPKSDTVYWVRILANLEIVEY